MMFKVLLSSYIAIREVHYFSFILHSNSALSKCFHDLILSGILVFWIFSL